MPTKLKRCASCREIKSTDSFTRNSYCCECARAIKKAWRQANAEHVRRYQSKWYQANREKAQAYERDRTQQADVRARRAATERLRKARLRRALTDDDYAYMEIIRRDPCSYCGATGGTVDHIIPLSREGEADWSNLTGCCAQCNRSKRTKPMLLAFNSLSRVGD